MAGFLAGCEDSNKKPEAVEKPTTDKGNKPDAGGDNKPDTGTGNSEKTDAEKTAEQREVKKDIVKQESPVNKIAATKMTGTNFLGLVGYKSRSGGISTRVGAVKDMLNSKDAKEQENLATVENYIFRDGKFLDSFNEILKSKDKQPAIEILADLMYIIAVYSLNDISLDAQKKAINSAFGKIIENANKLDKISPGSEATLKDNLTISMSNIPLTYTGKGAENIQAFFNS